MRPKDGHVWVMRTCSADMNSYGGFQWPESGPVEAPDWSPVPECGNGLHGALWGEGDGSLLSFSSDAKWLVVEVLSTDVVDLARKVKFPRGTVIYCGDRLGATDLMRSVRPGAIIGGTATAGDCGTATAGDCGTATAGCRGEIRIQCWDHVAGRRRAVIGYTGEGGLLPGVAYRLDAEHHFERADGGAA